MSDAEWNPTIRTPDGKELEPDACEGYIAEYRKESVLRECVNDGLTTQEIADKFGVNTTTIQEHMRRQGVTRPGTTTNRKRYAQTREIHNQSGVVWGTNQYANDGQGRVERKADGGEEPEGPFHCPDCGDEHATEAAQHECMREHARDEADKLDAHGNGELALGVRVNGGA